MMRFYRRIALAIGFALGISLFPMNVGSVAAKSGKPAKPSHVVVAANRKDLLVAWYNENPGVHNSYVVTVHAVHVKRVLRIVFSAGCDNCDTNYGFIPWKSLPGKGKLLYRVSVAYRNGSGTSAPKWQDGFTTPKMWNLMVLEGYPAPLHRMRGTRFYTTTKPKSVKHPKTVAAEKKSVKHCLADGAYAGGAAGGTTAAIGWISGPFDLAATGVSSLGGFVGGFVTCMSDR